MSVDLNKISLIVRIIYYYIDDVNKWSEICFLGATDVFFLISV